MLECPCQFSDNCLLLGNFFKNVFLINKKKSIEIFFDKFETKCPFYYFLENVTNLCEAPYVKMSKT